MRCLAAAILGLGTFFAALADIRCIAAPDGRRVCCSTELHTRDSDLKSLESPQIHRTSPTFTWGGSDMLWVQKDVSGKPQFAMNHAYPIDNDSGAAMWAVSTPRPLTRAQGFVDYTRMVTSGEVLSKSRDGSQLYLVKWPSRQITGTGPVAVTRNLFVLREENDHWKFVGEGPMTIDARSDNKHVSTVSSFPRRVDAERDEADQDSGDACQTKIDLS